MLCCRGCCSIKSVSKSKKKERTPSGRTCTATVGASRAPSSLARPSEDRYFRGGGDVPCFHPLLAFPCPATSLLNQLFHADDAAAPHARAAHWLRQERPIVPGADEHAGPAPTQGEGEAATRVSSFALPVLDAGLDPLWWRPPRPAIAMVEAGRSTRRGSGPSCYDQYILISK